MKYFPVNFGLNILILFFAISPCLYARETPSQRLLRREISYMTSKSNSPGTQKAIEVYSRRQRRTIFSSNAGLLLLPASNLKIVTTSFALNSLGKNYLFTTPFDIAGVQRGDSLVGDLVVVGMGDPIVRMNDLDSAAKAIEATGITTVTGNLVVDISKFDSLEWGAGWMWDDEPEPYAMFIGPVELQHDVVSVNVSLDATGRALDVTTYPETSFIKVENLAQPGELDTLNVTRDMINGINTIVVTGTYTDAFSPATYQFSVRHPAHYFGTVFRELLEKHGVTILGHLKVTRSYTDHSPRVQVFTLIHGIDTVITYINHVSDNLGAECLLREVPMAAGEVGSARNGIALEKKFLAVCGVDTTQYFIVDGSGVSHYDLITPNAIVRVLRYDLDQPYNNIFINSLPIGGETGTLQDRMTQSYVKGLVHAKTGSLLDVRTLSGYIFVPQDTLVFSMMMENIAWNADSMRALQDSICTLLTQYSPNIRIFVNNLRRHRIGTFGALRYRRRIPIRHEPRKAPSRYKKTTYRIRENAPDGNTYVHAVDNSYRVEKADAEGI